MGASRRNTYTPEYRREAARLVVETARTAAAVAREIGVGERRFLGRRVHAERPRTGGGSDAPLDMGERAELERSRREIQELRMGNESGEKRRRTQSVSATPSMIISEVCCGEDWQAGFAVGSAAAGMGVVEDGSIDQ